LRFNGAESGGDRAHNDKAGRVEQNHRGNPGGKGPRHDSCHAGRAAAARRERRVPAETILDMEAAGFFRILQPARWGGYEMKPRVFYDVLMALAEGDMSTGWVYGVLGVHPWLTGLMDDHAVHDVWADDDTTRLCSSLMPAGRAEPVEGGFRLTGHWRFSSGCDYAKWALLGAAVHTEAEGTPDIRIFMVPHTEYQISDIWFVSGLCATGSQDILVNETFVPSARVYLCDKRAVDQDQVRRQELSQGHES
jgi:3-hydroxy-9,10-secoandrosta-1,3,5(10)-triene-9,17-dione monooxygenase